MSLRMPYDLSMHLNLLALLTVGVLLFCILPAVVLSLVYSRRTNKSFIKNLFSTYPIFVMVGISVIPLIFLGYVYPTDSDIFSGLMSDTVFIVSTVVPFYSIATVLFWRLYEKNNTITIGDVLSSTVGLIFFIILLLISLYGVLFVPSTGIAIVCDSGIQPIGCLEPIEERGITPTHDVKISTEKVSESETYDIEIRLEELQYDEGGIYIIEPDGSRTSTIHNPGDTITVDSVKKGDSITVIGRYYTGDTGVIREYRI